MHRLHCGKDESRQNFPATPLNLIVLIFIAVAFCQGTNAHSGSPSDGGRLDSNFNQGWQFFRPAPSKQDPSVKTNAAIPAQRDTDSMPENVAWEEVNAPHSVRLEPLNASGGRNYQGVAWYRKRFLADRDWQGKRVYIRFEGAMQVSDVWLNGNKLTTHYGGYLPFTVELTGSLQLGVTNLIALKLDNSDNPEVPPGKPQSSLDFTYFGGLYRDVRLQVMEPIHITDEFLANKVASGGLFVRFPQVDAEKAIVEVQTDIANESSLGRKCRLRQELLDSSGTLVIASDCESEIAAGHSQATTQTLAVVHPQLWHPNHPYLYTLRTLVQEGNQTLDTRSTRIGIRRFEFKPEGLFINGKKYFAQGFNRHQDHPYVGYALSDNQHYRDAKKMRDAGLTSFRSHYPQAPAFMDACDELGILCIISNPGWQFLGNRTWMERTFQSAREMVRRDRNHPCALLWEPFPNETGYDQAYARKLYDLVHAEYPGDQCFVAGDGETGHAKQFIEVVWSRELVEGKPFWGREWGDSVDNWSDQQGRVRVARGWGEVPLITQAVNHALKLDTMLKNDGGGPAMTRLSGACVWAGIDCYRGYHHQPFLGGPLDLFRLPKFDYYFFQSQRDPQVKVAGVDCGPMVFIANYASAYSPAMVTIFSNCEEVRFYENGKLLATQKPDAGYVLAHPPFTFKAKARDTEKSTYFMSNDNAANSEYDYHYQAAEYRAEGLIAGRVVAEHGVKAPGVMHHIQLEPDYAGRDLIADGSDWLRVYAKVCDARGTVSPFADDLVTFAIEGEGSIIGDSAIGANPVKAEAGIATILVKSSTRPGKLRINATAFGLKSAVTEIESHALRDRIH